MFEILKKIFMNKTFSTEIMNNFVTMISQSEEMLKYAFKKLTIDGKTTKSQKKIYSKDQNINLTEREIRRRILIHLAANPDIDLPYCFKLSLWHLRILKEGLLHNPLTPAIQFL